MGGNEKYNWFENLEKQPLKIMNQNKGKTGWRLEDQPPLLVE